MFLYFRSDNPFGFYRNFYQKFSSARSTNSILGLNNRKDGKKLFDHTFYSYCRTSVRIPVETRLLSSSRTIRLSK